VKHAFAYKRLRQRLVLTPEEKKVILFAVLMFLLGLTAKQYRKAHPVLSPTSPIPASVKHLPAPRFP
jgi:hypothetical protein